MNLEVIRMPLCGFNEKMLEGLKMFGEGLVEHGLIERSRVKDQSPSDTLDRELLDMEKFLQEMSHVSNPEIKNVVEGLTLYAKGVYGLMRGQDVSQYKGVIQRLNALFFGMDEEYYSRLEGRPQAMEELVSWINQRRENATKRI